MTRLEPWPRTLNVGSAKHAITTTGPWVCATEGGDFRDREHERKEDHQHDRCGPGPEFVAKHGSNRPNATPAPREDGLTTTGRDELAHYGRRTAGCARTSKSSARRLGLTGTLAQLTSSPSSVRRREWYAWSSLRARRRTDSVPSTWTRPVRVVLLLSSRRPPRILQDRPRP